MEKTVIKKCAHHGDTEYALRSDGRYRCRKCSMNAVIKRRKDLKQKAINYKGGKCEICGYDRCNQALQFHHLDPSKKDFGISAHGFTRSWDKVKSEIDKCILVCGNCHSEIHSGMIEM
jgi:hypothetical protein